MKPRKLPSGSWNVRVMIDGQSYSFTHADKKTALRMASDFADEYRRKMDNPTLLERMREYVAENAERLSPSTVRSYNGMIRMIAERTPRIANKRLSAITEQDVSDIVRPLRTLKTKRNYVNFIHACTGKSAGKLTGVSSKRVHVPTELEVKGLLQIFRNTELEVPIMLAAYGGLRRGEICALRMSDIDGDFVHVSRAVVRDPSGEWVTKDPKTASSVRSVLLPHFVIERIREQGYITHLLPSQVSNRFWKKQRNLGIPPYCFHSLRHFHASYLHYLNIPDAYIMQRGGWSTPSVMQSIYRHALEDKVTPTDIFAVSAFQNPFQ
jgi:integrase